MELNKLRLDILEELGKDFERVIPSDVDIRMSEEVTFLRDVRAIRFSLCVPCEKYHTEEFTIHYSIPKNWFDYVKKYFGVNYSRITLEKNVYYGYYAFYPQLLLRYPVSDFVGKSDIFTYNLDDIDKRGKYKISFKKLHCVVPYEKDLSKDIIVHIIVAGIRREIFKNENIENASATFDYPKNWFERLKQQIGSKRIKMKKHTEKRSLPQCYFPKLPHKLQVGTVIYKTFYERGD